MKRHWTINGRFLAQPTTGVQRYGRQVLDGLDALIAEGHPLARNRTVELVTPASVSAPPRLRAIASRRAGRFDGHLWEQAELPFMVNGGLVSLCNTGPLSVRRQIICIHDVNTRVFPQSYRPAFRAFYRVLLPAEGRVAASVATVSQYSAGQLADHRIAAADKIFVAPNGCDHALQWRPTHSDATRAAAGPNTIVLIGSRAPHKNMGLVVDMASKLADEGMRVAIAGIADSHVFSATGLAPSADNIVWLGRLSDNELAALLRDSLCLAFPSFIEGFGLPVVEAMALGCPVVSSDRASLPEVGGDAVLYAPPDDEGAWLAAFRRLRGDAELRSQLIEKGRRRAEHFRWRRTAEIYLQAMARIDSAPALS